MSSLGARLREYSRREASFADVRSECIRLASADEHTIAQGRRQLAKALAAGTIAPEQFERLEQAIQSVVLADGGSIDSIPDAADRTDIGRVRGRPVPSSPVSEDDEDTTVLRDEPVDAQDDEDTTVLRDESVDAEDDDEATVLRDWNTGSDEKTRTDFLADDEETVLRSGGNVGDTAHTEAADDDDETTVLRKDFAGHVNPDSEDVTVRPGAELEEDDDDEDPTVILGSAGGVDPDDDATIV